MWIPAKLVFPGFANVTWQRPGTGKRGAGAGLTRRADKQEERLSWEVGLRGQCPCSRRLLLSIWAWMRCGGCCELFSAEGRRAGNSTKLSGLLLCDMFDIELFN